MNDESCKVPREDLDDGFNPCRKQVVENGDLCQYAHMYDVMNERYDREEDTRYLDSVKRDKITSTTPVLLAGNNTQIYASSTNGEGLVNMLPSSAFNNPSNHTETSIPSAKAVADYVTANISPATPPSNFSFQISPFPADDWEGEMTVNVIPVFSVNIGAVTYVIARVYGSKKFNYTGTADNINLFLSLKHVGDYTSIFSGSTNIPLTLSVSGRSYTAGTYGLTPNVSGSNLSLNNQIVSSVFNLGDFNISNNLKCVFGEGTNTPGVTVSVNCMALMWHSLS